MTRPGDVPSTRFVPGHRHPPEHQFV